MLRTRRSQVTLFVIAGIILLLIFGLFFVLRERISGAKVSVAQQVVENVPLEFNLIKSFTDNCLKVVSEQGLALLGQQGGYIKPEQWHHLEFRADRATDSDGLSFSGSDIRVPYWYYNHAPNDGSSVVLVSQRPSVADMEKDLKQWVEEQLAGCVGNYSSFTEQGFQIEEKEPPTVTVTLVPHAVRVALDHPLRVTRGQTVASLRSFFVEIPVDVLRMYDIASRIWGAEVNASFLEKNTLSLLTIFSGTNPSQLPPMTESTFQFTNPISWNVEKVKNDTKLLLMNYIPLLRYGGAGNYYTYLYPSDDTYLDTKQRIYNNMILPLNGAEGLDVRFNYLDLWEPYMSFNSEGGIIRPQSTSVSFAGISFGVQRFKTVYDLSYPVWISLYDPHAMDGQGFFFNFALESNIRNNRPVTPGEQLLPTVRSFSQSLFCDDNQRTSKPVTLLVRDGFTDEPVSDVHVSYSLGDITCPLGVTDAYGAFVSPFPVALGGIVHFDNPLYGSRSEYLDASREKPVSSVAHLWKYKTIDVAVQKKNLLKGTQSGVLNAALPGWSFQGASVPLSSDEQATVSLHRVDSLDEPLSVATSISGSEKQTVRLLPGVYEVTLQSLLNRRVFIPAEQREKDGVSYWAPPQPGIEFNPFPSGTIEWNTAATYLDVNASSLYTSPGITFYVLTLGLDSVNEKERKIEDIEMMSKLPELSQTYRIQLEPQYTSP